jgi:acyl-coenzyme A synthetase/AMP-(fatty) acid ligase/acyl carrier protein
VTHRALVSYALGLVRELGLAAGDRMLQFASLGFDVAVEEIFPPLLAGGTVVLRDPIDLASGEGLRRAIAEDGVTVVELPTAFWHEWVYELSRTGQRPAPCLRLMLIGGEPVLPDRLQAWLELGIPLVHVFGLTEVTVTSCLYPVPADFDGPSLPIGRPFGGNRTYVLDAGLGEAPIGVEGELYLGGTCLARCYLGRPELTAQRFVPDPFAEPGGRMYRTGDRSRQLADGRLEFLGRIDLQVKIRGFRIEPGEIEAAIALHPEVRDGVVVTREDHPGDRRLIAYVVGRDGLDPDPGARVRALRAFLAERLPDHMVPSWFVFLAELPLTPNGKIDRRALPAPEGFDAGRREFVPPRTPFEEQIASIWSEVLGVERVGAGDNFFELGGHSLSAIRVAARLSEAFHSEVPVRTLFLQPTLEELAANLAAVRQAAASEETLEEQAAALRERIRQLRLAQELVTEEAR